MSDPKCAACGHEHHEDGTGQPLSCPKCDNDTWTNDSARAAEESAMLAQFKAGALTPKCDGSEDCGDYTCQECCPHGEHDHGICLDCGKDRLDELVCAAEYAFEGDR